MEAGARVWFPGRVRLEECERSKRNKSVENRSAVDAMTKVKVEVKVEVEVKFNEYIHQLHR